MTSSSSFPTPAEAALPGQMTRTVVSFLLFVHFFALAVAVASNWSPSPLALRLRRVPLLLQYLQFLDMDQSYIGLFNLHDGLPEDTDAVVEIDLKFRDGTEEHAIYPPAGLWPRQRRQHYARLAETAADLSENQDLQSIVPQAIAAHLAEKANAEGKKIRSGDIRVRRLLLQPIEAVESSLPNERDPRSETYFRKLYEAHVLLAGGRVQLLKVEEARYVAPAASSSAGSDQNADKQGK